MINNQVKIRNFGVVFFTLVIVLTTLFAPVTALSQTGTPAVTPDGSPSNNPSNPPDGPAITNEFLPYVVRASQTNQNIFGIESYNFLGDNQTKGGQLGARYLRRNALLWSDVEATEGVYHWNAASVKSMETDILNANISGMEVMLIVRSTPTWAQLYPGVLCGPIKQTKLAAFGNFMNEVVTHFSVPPYNVKYFQIWNEPDVDKDYVPWNQIYGCWADGADPYYGGRYFGEALKAVYPRIKQADPNAQVVIGGLLLACEQGVRCNWQGDKFLEGILIRNGSNDGMNYFDYVAYHTYDDYWGTLGRFSNYGWSTEWNDEGPSIVGKTRYVKSVLAKYNASHKGLIVSEIALRCGTDLTKPSCSAASQADFIKTKTSYIPQAFGAAIKEGIHFGIWYDLSGSWLQTALLTSNHSYTDGYWAYKTAVELLQDTVFVRDITEYPGVTGYVFQRNGREVWLIWSHDGNSHNIILPSLPTAGYTVLKAPVSVLTLNFQVNIMPVYFEW